MREIVKGIFLQEGYPGVRLGAVVCDGAALLIDSPLRIGRTRVAGGDREPRPAALGGAARRSP
jgi:hypothetical protein